MKYLIALVLLASVVVIGLSVDPGEAQPSGVGVGGRCSGNGNCSSGSCTMLGNGVGVCVDVCSAACAPGQKADRRAGGCTCVAPQGPGQPCTSSTDCTNGTCQTFLAGTFSDGTPAAGVCVPNGTPTCNPGKTCMTNQTCAMTSASSGLCTASVTVGPKVFTCRFDESATSSGCQPTDPFGRACGSCTYGPAARTCDGNLKRCVPNGICTPEVCGNGIDEDCSGADLACPPCTQKTWYRDADGDGFGNSRAPTTSCTQPPGYVADATDCDDTRANRHPGMAEICGDGIDNNCDGNCDEGCFNVVYEKALCPGQTNYALCDDNMLTYDTSEGPQGPFTTLITYKQPIPGVTDNRQLIRCFVNGIHFVTIGENNCSNIEGEFGYPMTSFKGGYTLLDCYTNSSGHHGQQIEVAEWSRSPTPDHCVGTPPRAKGPWKMFGVLGYMPSYGGSPPNISSCWGQQP